MANKRELVEMEMLTSERRYCRDIGTFLDVFIRPMMRHARRLGRNACVSESEVLVLECSLEKISAVTKELLAQLEQERSGASQYSKTIGKVFIDESEQLRRAYVAFVSGYRTALDMHSDLMQRKKKKGASCSYAHFIKNCVQTNQAEVGNKNFGDFFILPIQRVPRYRLLLQELLKRVPGRYERAYIKEAIKRVCIIADEMNYRLRQTIDVNNGPSLRPRMPSSDSTAKKEDEIPLDTIEEETEADTVSAGDNQELLNDLGDATNEDGDASEGEYPSRVSTEISRNSSDAIQQKTTSRTIGTEDSGLHYLDEEENVLEIHRNKEDKLDRWLDFRGWRGEDLPSAPTANSFALYAVAAKGNPFKGMELNALTPHSLSNKLDSLYCKLARQSPEDSVVPLYRPQPGDVVVCGPPRSGQTPVIHALDCFRSETFPSRNPHAVLDRIGFLQWETWEQDQQDFKSRILKTHQELRHAFGGTLSPALKASRPAWKVIVTLRHPADLRTSYYRHIRRMFRKLNPELNFDRIGTQDDFADCLPEYEQFIADVLKVVVEIQSPQLLVIFYEELIADPAKVAQRIADFIDFQPAKGNKIAEDRDTFIRQVSLSITSSPYFIGYSSRVGSCNEGREHFSKASLSKMDVEWDAKIKSRFRKYGTYETLFCTMTGLEQYPYDEYKNEASSRTTTPTKAFSFFSKTASTKQNAGSSSMMETSVHGGSESGRDRDDGSEHGDNGSGKLFGRRSGSFLGLGRLTKAFSISSSSERERGESIMSEQDWGTSCDKAIDPDDSDEEEPEDLDDLLALWSEYEEE